MENPEKSLFKQIQMWIEYLQECTRNHVEKEERQKKKFSDFSNYFDFNFSHTKTYMKIEYSKPIGRN